MNLYSVTVAARPRVLCVEGDVEGDGVELLASRIREESDDFESAITIELSDVTFLPSLGVSALVVAMQDARERGSELRLAARDGSVAQRVLHMCGLPYVGTASAASSTASGVRT